MTNWFIIAGGTANRCGGYVKQLFPVLNEPIIYRTVRLIREADSESKIYIVSWRPELEIDGCERLDIGLNGKIKAVSLTHALRLTSPYWGDKNAFLTGDTIFDTGVIYMINRYAGEFPLCYGKYRDDKHNRPERYALTFGGVYSGYMRYEMQNGMLGPMCNELPCCIMDSRWRDFLEWLNRRTTIKWINKACGSQSPAGFLGYIYHNTFLVNYLARKAPMVNISDHESVTDIDTLEEYEDWVKQYGSVSSD